METLTRIFLGLAAALPVLSSCQGMFADRQGTIRISFLDERTVQTRASDRIPPTDDFILTVTSSGGDTVYEGRFGDSPEELTVQPGSYTFMVSVMVLCMVVLGGMGNLKGVILGAFIIEFIQYFPQLVGLSSVIPAQASQVLYGLVLVIMMICRPQGILGRDKYRYGEKKQSLASRLASRRGGKEA